MEYIQSLFSSNKILTIYRAGSCAYGVIGSASDEDFVVVLDEFSGMMHIPKNDDGKEYFVFGRQEWIKKMEFDEGLATYFKLFPDEVIGNIPLYLDEGFEGVYTSYQTREWVLVIKVQLSEIINFFSLYLEDGILTKLMWHLFRLEEQVLRFTSTGLWTLDLSNEVKEKILIYKDNYRLQSQDYVDEFKHIIEYLKEVMNS